MAVLHGADSALLNEETPTAPEELNRNLLFGDPKDYEKMSEDERKNMSDKMRKKFMTWTGAKKNG